MARDYGGAVGRLALEQARELDAGWRLQPKVDGMYATVLLGDQGQVVELRARSGRVIGEHVHRLSGEILGPAWSILAGELEASTEAGIRAAASNEDGLPTLHLFDAVQLGSRDLRCERYDVRRDLLCRAHAQQQERDRRPGWYRDRTGRGHDRVSGDFCRRIRSGWRRTRIVPQLPLAALEREYERARVEADVEGLVAVAQAAPLGARRAKLKIKPLDTLDVLVVERHARRVRCWWAGMALPVWVGAGAHDPRPGQLWELACDGFYDSFVPKFPRLVRLRTDKR